MISKKEPVANPTALILQNRMLSELPPLTPEKKSVLKSINANSNYISSLPNDIKDMDSLTSLTLTRNQFTSLPKQLINHPSIDQLVFFFF
jgi:Leucine-rich repeat (LRR) protein